MKKRRNRVTAELVIAPNEILTKVCEPVYDDEDVFHIIADMLHILNRCKTGVGLAAPQAGHLKRIIVVSSRRDSFLIMLNPIVTLRSPYFEEQYESCLSYPGARKKIIRNAWVEVNYQREDGGHQKHTFGEWDSRIIQHEIDHLNGKCKVGATL